MTATYLGLPARTVVAVGALVAVVGVVLGLAVPTYGDRVLARCADLNGAALTPEACAAYLAEVDAVVAACGHLADQLPYERCADDVLAVIRTAPCGIVAEVEDGVARIVPASCSTPDELADRMARIRDERGGDRFP